jgi:hypothetical protein
MFSAHQRWLAHYKINVWFGIEMKLAAWNQISTQLSLVGISD